MTNEEKRQVLSVLYHVQSETNHLRQTCMNDPHVARWIKSIDRSIDIVQATHSPETPDATLTPQSAGNEHSTGHWRWVKEGEVVEEGATVRHIVATSITVYTVAVDSVDRIMVVYHDAAGEGFRSFSWDELEIFVENP